MNSYYITFNYNSTVNWCTTNKFTLYYIIIQMWLSSKWYIWCQRISVDMKFVVKSVANGSVPSWSPIAYVTVSIWLPILLRTLQRSVDSPVTVHWYCTACDRHTELWQVLNCTAPINTHAIKAVHSSAHRWQKQLKTKEKQLKQQFFVCPSHISHTYALIPPTREYHGSWIMYEISIVGLIT